jgi:ABC-type Fe3+/spermidine/putrescine transport system ATPase subunit
MQLELKHLQERLGITVIYVTHDQEEALTMSDRIAVLSQGRLVQVGPPDELYEHPADFFVAQFFGESNLLHGVLTEPGEGVAQLLTDGGLLVRISRPPISEPGARLRIALRPERIGLARGELSFVNHFRGVVEEVIYVGEATRYTVRVGRESVTVKQSNESGRDRFKQGDTIMVGWDPEDCLIL